MATSTFSPMHRAATSPQKQTMSVAQTYFLAHKARAKLSAQANRANHDLRQLVGHANLLDGLMVELADAEREQEARYSQPARTYTHEQGGRHQLEEEDWEADSDLSDDSSDSDSDSDDDGGEDFDEMREAAGARSSQPHTPHDECEDDDYDYEEDYESLALTRAASHSASPPPELLLDDGVDSSSEDEAMPPFCPDFATLPSFAASTDKLRQAETASVYLDPQDPDGLDKSDFYQQGFYIPPRNAARLVSEVSAC